MHGCSTLGVYVRINNKTDCEEDDAVGLLLSKFLFDYVCE